PFLAGFGLEIILSGITSNLVSTMLVTTGAILGLWIQEFPGGHHPSLRTVALQTCFLVATGALTSYVARHWARTQDESSRRAVALHQRLEVLEKELADARCLGKVGEETARFAHGLKNAVHSLQGFVRLIEPRFMGGVKDRLALEGLRSGIGHLEEIAK